MTIFINKEKRLDIIGRDIDPYVAKDLFLAFFTTQTFFRAQLFRLMGKADDRNFARLATAFPAETRAWEQWRLMGERAFFTAAKLQGVLREPERSLYLGWL